MIVKRLLTPQQPFADDTSGFGYFATDLHYRRLAATICRRIAPSSGIVLVTGDPAPDGELLMACLNGEGQTGHRATLVSCAPGTGFDALVRDYSEQLGLAADEEGGNLWPLISHLMLESRKGVTRLLLVDNADALDDKVFDELYRFAKVDDPHLLPVLLLATSAFDKRINTPALSFLKPAIVAQLPLHHLDADEVAAFIHYQLNAAEGAESDAFPPETIEAIAAAADGDPSIVNCLAREALAFRRRRAAATLAAVPVPAVTAPAEPAPQPVEDAPAAASEAAAEPEAPAEAPEIEPAFAPIDAAAADESAKKTTLIELAAIARQTDSKPPAREEGAPPEEKPAPAAEADPPLELEPATMAAKLAEPASAKPRRSNTGLAAIAYLLLAAVSGSALLYLILPGASDRVPSNVTAEAAVPQPGAPAEEPAAATPVVLAAESAAAKPSDTATTSAQPSLSPPPLPPESAMVPANAAPLVVKHEEAPAREPASLLAAMPTSQAIAAEPLPPPSPPAAAEKVATTEAPPPVAKNLTTANAAPPAAEKTPAPAPLVAEKVAVPDSPPPAPEKVAAEAPRPATAERLAMVEPSSPAPALASEQILTEASLAPAVAALPATPAPAVTSAPAAPVAVPAPVAAAPAPAAPRVAALEPMPAAPAASHAADRPPPAEIAVLIRRGDQLLAAGDIISARRFFERAATSGDPSASLGLAKSYDPLFLQQTGARGVSGKPADAAMWYRKAVEAGSMEASTRLNRLLARYPQ